MAHQTGVGAGVVLLFVLVGGAIFIGYHFYAHSAKPFSFHYFKVRHVLGCDVVWMSLPASAHTAALIDQSNIQTCVCLFEC